MRFERRSSKILHCLQWYKLVLRTRLSTPAVQYPIRQGAHIQASIFVSTEKKTTVAKYEEKAYLVLSFRHHFIIIIYSPEIQVHKKTRKT